MSGTLPASPAPARASIRSVTPTLLSTAYSLKRNVRTRNAHRWAFEVEWPWMNRAAFDPLWAFLLAQRGQFETFTFVPPRIATAKGALGGTPVAASTAVGSRSATLSGASNNVTGWAKAGDYFKWSNHAKVYVVTADANSNGSGQVSLSFEPALMATVPVSTGMTWTSVPWTVALTGDERVGQMEQGGLYSLAAAFIEAP